MVFSGREQVGSVGQRRFKGKFTKRLSGAGKVCRDSSV